MNKKDLIMLYKTVKMFWLTLVFVAPYISMLSQRYAYEQRGYWAAGGELCVPLFIWAAVFGLIYSNAKLKERIKDENKKERREVLRG